MRRTWLLAFVVQLLALALLAPPALADEGLTSTDLALGRGPRPGLLHTGPAGPHL